MKPQFSLTCILGSAIFFSQLASAASITAEPQVSLMTSKEISEYASGIAENIRKTAIAILCVPPGEQTFENTLRPWNRLSAQLAQDFNTLDALGKLDSPSDILASRISDNLHAYLLEVTQNPEFQQTLINCFLDITNNTELNSFQRYLGARFVKNGSNEPVYLRGSSEEQNTSTTDFIILNLKSGSLATSEISDLANKILSENADVVCIQEVLADDHAYDLYETLEGNYAHFIYVPPTAAFDLPGSGCVGGMLIASKYRMEQTQFNTFLEERSESNEGFLDFVLKNANTTLGHVYAANLKRAALNEIISYKFVQIMEKMQDDVLKIEEKSVPFVLCGDLNDLHGFQESKMIMESCFGHEYNNSVNNCTLLLQSLPHLKISDYGHTLSTTSMTMPRDHSGLRTLVKRVNSHFINYGVNSTLNHQQSLTAQKMDSLAKDSLKIAQNTFEILPTKSHRDRDDDKGGNSCEGGITGRWGDGNGIQWEGYIKGEVHDDNGNYAEGRITQKDDGTGEVDVHGGHESPKK